MLHWQRQGKGPDVVLVHGYLGSGKIFEPLVEHLRHRFSVTTIDLPGFAGSYDVPVPPTVEELSQMVVKSLRSAGIDKCSMLGHSLGAWVALEVSLQNPELLQKMVLYGGSSEGLCPERFETYEKSIEKLHRIGIDRFAADVAAEWFRLGKEDVMYRLAIEAGRHSNETAAICHLKSWRAWKASHRLSEVKTSTLIVCGDCDRSTHPDLSIEMWKNIQGSQLFIAPNAGHIVHLELIPEFNSIVTAFFE